MNKRKVEPKVVPQPALIVEIGNERAAYSPVKRHLLGVFNEKNQFIIKRGNELVIVEVPTK